MNTPHAHDQHPAEAAPEERKRRRQRLIKPGVQLRLSVIFAGLTVMCLLIQWLLFSSMLTSAAQRMPVGGEYLLDLIPTLLTRSILVSLGVALPLTLLVGIHSTFPITGPIYRFESYLGEVIKGTQLGPCKIRQGDSFGTLCELINEATEPVRRRTIAPEQIRAESESA